MAEHRRRFCCREFKLLQQVIVVTFLSLCLVAKCKANSDSDSSSCCSTEEITNFALSASDEDSSSDSSTSECKCDQIQNQNGKEQPPAISQKIVGGTEARLNEFPFQVYFFSGKPYCGGAILNENHVLTAVHCLLNGRGKRIKQSLNAVVVAGDLNWRTTEAQEQRRSIAQVFPSNTYNAFTFADDIAVVRVTPPFTFNAAVKPARLPEPDYEVAEDVTVTGWGYLWVSDKNHSVQPSLLHKVSIPIVPNPECAQLYGSVKKSSFQITDNMICAGIPREGGRGSCNGDSGGPLTIKSEDESSVVVGVVASGAGCAHPNFPGVYTKVSKFVNWVRGIAGADTFINDVCAISGKYSQRNLEVVFVDCYGTIRIPSSAGTKGSFLLEFKSTRNNAYSRQCYWTMDKGPSGAISQMKVRITLCKGSMGTGGPLTVRGGFWGVQSPPYKNVDENTVIYETNPGSWDTQLNFNFLSSRARGTGFKAFVEVIEAKYSGFDLFNGLSRFG